MYRTALLLLIAASPAWAIPSAIVDACPRIQPPLAGAAWRRYAAGDTVL